MQYYLNLIMVLLTIVMLVPLTGSKLATIIIIIPVNVDKDDNLGVFGLMEILDKATNYTKEIKRGNMNTIKFDPYLSKMSQGEGD